MATMMLASTSRRALPRLTSRAVHTAPAPALASARYTDASNAAHPSVSSTPSTLTPAQKALLDAALRVDQAGEVAANYIYRGQLAMQGPRDRAIAALIQEMWDQEKKHLAVMNKLQVQHDVRPTLLWDVARVAGYGLGAATALLGKEAAMACTEAVETVIGEHYDDQLKEMAEFPDHPSIELLKDVIREFRDDELEHLDIAVEHDSQKAPAHALLSSIVGGGCKVAIELCKRI